MAGAKIMGLWIKKGSDGKEYFEGSLGNMTVRVYNNDYKKQQNHPDFVVYLSPKPKPQQAGQRPQQGYSRPQSQGPRQAPPQRPAPPQRAPQTSQQEAYKDHTQAQEPPSDLWDRDEGSPDSDLPF